jgi:threonine/homoserine/homoserine lactone efflux protein
VSRDNYHVLMARLPIWSYLAVTVPLVLTPGASTAVVLRNSLTGGIRAGAATAIGTNLASLCYGLLSAFGLALALRRWPSVWEVVRIAGAAYLAWLGVRSIRRAFEPEVLPVATVVEGRSSGRLRPAFEGFAINALNPAIATFYLVILPQFIPPDAPAVRTALILTAVHVSLAWSWHMAWAAAGGTLARSLTGGLPRRVLSACTGVALLGLAIAMVT